MKTLHIPAISFPVLSPVLSDSKFAIDYGDIIIFGVIISECSG